MWNKVMVGGLLTLVAVAAGAGFGIMRRPPVATLASPTVTAGLAPSESTVVEVHVAGWVNEPGVVTVAEGSIVADAIERAGGLRPGADAEAINLAAEVGPGQQIVVPGPGNDGDESAGAGTTAGPLSLNQAAVSELETLPGVGPVLAQRIVDFRETHGRFETVEDLLEVPGIGEAKLASLRDLVRP